ncbi:MAG: IroE protein [Burkholderiales bacterium PBB4]|nr:MAG: IroE protein [Burkholderiales bacterium PBB4]
MFLSRVLRTLRILLAFVVVGTALPTSATAAAPAYQIPNSFVHELPRKGTTRTYQVWVSLPVSYASGSKQYPVVFVTDPQYAFALVHGIRHLLGRRGQNIEDFILVGLALPTNEDAAEARSRDYTPTNALVNPKRRPDEYGAKVYGEAAAYRSYVETEVFPLIASQYRADMSRKVFIGHSYGALWGAATLLARPDMFQAYILGSPSFWFDQKVIFQIEQQYAADHKDLKANVQMFAGSFEAPGPSKRHYKETDLAGDMKRFKETLKRRRYAGLQVTAEVLQGEDHFTVYTTLVGRGLLKVLPGFGPYISG